MSQAQWHWVGSPDASQTGNSSGNIGKEPGQWGGIHVTLSLWA
jgi:hypothetical protein